MATSRPRLSAAAPCAKGSPAARCAGCSNATATEASPVARAASSGLTGRNRHPPSSCVATSSTPQRRTRNSDSGAGASILCAICSGSPDPGLSRPRETCLSWEDDQARVATCSPNKMHFGAICLPSFGFQSRYTKFLEPALMQFVGEVQDPSRPIGEEAGYQEAHLRRRPDDRF